MSDNNIRNYSNSSEKIKTIDYKNKKDENKISTKFEEPQKEIDLNANPAEAIGRSQVKRRDGFQQDMKFFIAHPEAAQRIIEFADILKENLEKSGAKNSYEMACEGMPVFQEEFAGYYKSNTRI